MHALVLKVVIGKAKYTRYLFNIEHMVKSSIKILSVNKWDIS